MKKIVFLLVCVFSSFAMAQLPTSDPGVVCSYAEKEGLPTNGWSVDSEGNGSCTSDFMAFGRQEVGPLHQISYQSRGDATSASVLQVIFDVNPPQAMSSANSRFLQISHSVSVAAFGKRLPSAISSAISGGREATATIGESTLKVLRQEHESGVGYQMRFTVE